LSLGVCALTAASASAATITTTTIDSCFDDLACSKYAMGTPVPVTVVTGNPGEANQITVTREGDAWVIRDTGAPPAGHAGCTTVDAAAVRCPATDAQGVHIPGLRLMLGDGDDTRAVAAGIPASVDAGPGADRVTGSDQTEIIDGGEGPDTLDGGAGADTLSFAARTTRVTVDVGSSSTGDGDTITGFERVVGSSAADSLRGGPAADALVGGPGADVLSGAGGTDALYGDEGDDRLRGGGGDDLLSGGDDADRLFGGAGDDELYGDYEQPEDYYEPDVRQARDRLDGGRGDDRLDDPGGRNVFVGGAGRDRLRADRRDRRRRC
jgi:Ca2+-binding RTX toxin-like protein